MANVLIPVFVLVVCVAITSTAGGHPPGNYGHHFNRPGPNPFNRPGPGSNPFNRPGPGPNPFNRPGYGPGPGPGPRPRPTAAPTQVSVVVTDAAPEATCIESSGICASACTLGTFTEESTLSCAGSGATSVCCLSA